MLTSMIAVGAVLMALTAILALLLVRAHDRTMARWNEQLEQTVAERTAQLIRTHRAIIFGIAKLAEYRDNDTGLHVERMSAYTGAIAREYQRQFGGLEPQWIEDLELAASMHDIGKVAVPDRILLKPGRLSEEEFEEMKVHSAIGEEALIAVREQVDDPHLLDLGIEISGGHHERWDGTGYPRGLAGEKIPLSARIVAVADVFDALMSKRVYKPAMPYEQVVETIRAGRGTHFDPRVVDSFEAVCGVLAVIHSRLQDGPGPRSPLPHAESRHELDPAGA
jgi:putative two-component system response regulator